LDDNGAVAAEEWRKRWPRLAVQSINPLCSMRPSDLLKVKRQEGNDGYPKLIPVRREIQTNEGCAPRELDALKFHLCSLEKPLAIAKGTGGSDDHHGLLVPHNVMHTVKPAVYKWRCDLNWTSKTPEVGLQTRFQADGLEIYTGTKI
jgi:hypothetical protein